MSNNEAINHPHTNIRINFLSLRLHIERLYSLRHYGRDDEASIRWHTKADHSLAQTSIAFLAIAPPTKETCRQLLSYWADSEHFSQTFCQLNQDIPMEYLAPFLSAFITYLRNHLPASYTYTNIADSLQEINDIWEELDNLTPTLEQISLQVTTDTQNELGRIAGLIDKGRTFSRTLFNEVTFKS